MDNKVCYFYKIVENQYILGGKKIQEFILKGPMKRHYPFLKNCMRSPLHWLFIMKFKFPFHGFLEASLSFKMKEKSIIIYVVHVSKQPEGKQ